MVGAAGTPGLQPGDAGPKPTDPAESVEEASFSLIENWSFVEADLLREYQVDVTRDLPTMTWRRFLILVRGLSPNSATIAHFRGRHSIGAKGTSVRTIDTPQAAEAAFNQLFAPPAGKEH